MLYIFVIKQNTSSKRVVVVGIAPPAHGGAVLRRAGGLAMLAGVHDDHQIPREIPPGHPARWRLRRVPRFWQQIHMEKGTNIKDQQLKCALYIMQFDKQV